MSNVKGRWMHGLQAVVIAAYLGLASACGGSETGMPADAPEDSEANARPETEEARIASAPTAAGELPSAILGTAPPLGGQDLAYMPDDSATSGYLALPEGDGPHPALILVHEWNGLTDRIRQVADAFAAEGYVALAADLYQGRTGGNREENMALVQETRGDMDQVIAKSQHRGQLSA